MMNGGKFSLFNLLAAAALVLFCAGNVLAAAQGDCVNCHTMHNSQDGASMMVDNTDAPAPALVRAGSCYGCHGDVDIINGVWEETVTAPGRTPRINAQTYGANGDTLAGGSFYWVDVVNADAKGHNVVGVAQMDVALGYLPPGWNTDFSANGTVNDSAASWTTQLTCAGTNGCHGDHAVADDFAAVKGGHHSGPTGLTDGTTVPTSYRFLKGIKGYEDSDWEYQPSETEHNQYYGKARSGDTAEDTHTISYLCAECHGNFHSGTGNLGSDGDIWGAPWLRHPTDFDMNDLSNTSEYASYNGDKSYSVVAPVASEDISSVKSAVLVSDGDAIVTCISCHRAHGSPYDDLLRWAYNEDGHLMKAGNDAGNVGCFICHTTKDDN